jgi:uncharacterized protein (PEP-CTERM system associated)
MHRMSASGTVALLALLAASAAAAQESNFVPAASADRQAPPGWSFTPSMTYSMSWDDNVLIRGNGDVAPGDLLNMVNPRGTLNLNGKRSQLSATYDGAFVVYRDLNSLNSYDQHASFYARQLIAPHVALFMSDTASSVPTTELSQLVGVPFVRTGSRLDDFHAGFDAAFTKRTSMVASYDFQWVQFDHSQPASAALHGGHGHGATMTLTHVMTEHFALTGAYDIEHATVGTLGQVFDVQNAWVGGDYKLTNRTRLFAAGGVSRLGVSEFADVRTGPAWRFGLTQQFHRYGVDLQFSRSYVPSYGFGGTTQNEEATLRFRAPLGRRIYSTGAFAWRANDPLTLGDLPLRSLWVEGNVGYMMTPWVHLEVFFEGTHQTIDRPGGDVGRNRIGFQVTTARPMRIQ